VEEACSWLDEFEALPSVTMVHPGKAHSGFLRHLLYSLGTGGNLVTDAHLAALALEHDATIATADRDFQRFPGLKVKIVF
jgi:predicted nucleic acid-binding protein